MNSYGQKVKCQNQNDGHAYKTQKTRMMHVSKKTNTPSEFLVCHQCQQIMDSKLNSLPVQMTVGDCGVGIAEYTKALNYINSCHSIINKMINRIQNSDSQTGQNLSMPDLPNFMDLFSSIHNIKEKKIYMNANKSPHHCSNQVDEEKCDSVIEDSDEKVEEQKQIYDRSNDHEKYLLSNLKQTDEIKMTDSVSQDNTTENDDSEIELNFSQQTLIGIPNNKFKPVTLQNTREKVIYEEINSHDEDSRCNLQSKQNKTEEPCPKQNNTLEFSPVRTRRSTNIPGRIKNPQDVIPNVSHSQGVNYLPTVVSTNTTQRKIKPRSASAKLNNNYVTSGGKKKDCIELNTNYSDTAISLKNTAKVNIKNQKPIAQPISFGPNSTLSQRELDKYAKELLGSGSVTPRSHSPDSRNLSPKQPTRSRIHERPKTHISKTTGSSKSKQVEVKKRPSQQEKQTPPLSASKSQPVQTQTVVMQQNECNNSKYKNCFAAVPFHKTMTESQQTNNQAVLQNTPKQQSMRANTTYLHSSTVTNLQSSTKTNVNVSPTIVCPTQSMKISQDDVDSHSTQQKYRRVKMRGPLTHTEQNCETDTKSPSKVQETQQSIVQMNHNVIMSRRMCPPTPVNNNSEVKAQFCVTRKPNDFFTVNRKTSSHHQRKSEHTYTNMVDAESDDIKTDSDLDDNHINNDEADKKSTSSSHIKKVLSNLGLLPSHVNPEMEHLKMEARFTRVNNEKNHPFREPRKFNPDLDPSEMVRISDDSRQNVYQGASIRNLHRTQSEESSDIKSDNEDDYLRMRTLNYSGYSANRYHQT